MHVRGKGPPNWEKDPAVPPSLKVERKVRVKRGRTSPPTFVREWAEGLDHLGGWRSNQGEAAGK